MQATIPPCPLLWCLLPLPYNTLILAKNMTICSITKSTTVIDDLESCLAKQWVHSQQIAKKAMHGKNWIYLFYMHTNTDILPPSNFFFFLESGGGGFKILTSILVVCDYQLSYVSAMHHYQLSIHVFMNTTLHY